MDESMTIDARGLSCPQPAMLTQKTLASLTGGAVLVLLDSATAIDNVVRIAREADWRIDVQEQPDGSWRVVLTK